MPITLAAAISKRLDAAWAAGTGEGGLDTGSKTTGAWYSVWLIGKADGTADALFSLEATAPTMPSGYGYKRRLGWVLTDGSGNILAFRQAGDRFCWKAPRQDAAGVTLSATAGLLTLSVPPASVARDRGARLARLGGPLRAVLLARRPDIAASATVHNARCLTNGGAQTAALEIPADASSRIRHRADAASTTLAELMTLGWIDRRGRDQ